MNTGIADLPVSVIRRKLTGRQKEDTIYEWSGHRDFHGLRILEIWECTKRIEPHLSERTYEVEVEFI